MELDKNIKLHLVIVDDSKDDHFFIKEALGEYKNIWFTSFYEGESFIDYLNNRSKYHPSAEEMPDVVILDINMPKLTGFEIYEKIGDMSILNNTKFCVLTTHLSPADRRRCEQLKLSCHTKPFSIDKFTALMEKILLELPNRNKRN